MSSSRPVTRNTTREQLIQRRKRSIQHRHLHNIVQNPSPQLLNQFRDTSCINCDPPLYITEAPYQRFVTAVQAFDEDITISGHNQTQFFRYLNNRDRNSERCQEFLKTLTFWKIPANFEHLAKTVRHRNTDIFIGQTDDLSENDYNNYCEEVEYLVEQQHYFRVQVSPFARQFPATPALRTFTQLQQEIENRSELGRQLTALGEPVISDEPDSNNLFLVAQGSPSRTRSEIDDNELRIIEQVREKTSQEEPENEYPTPDADLPVDLQYFKVENQEEEIETDAAIESDPENADEQEIDQAILPPAPVNLPPIQVNPPVQAVPINPPPHPVPQQDNEDEMVSIPYPVFDGTNPNLWLGQMERAFKANGIPTDQHDRRLGIAAYHMGSYQEWADQLNLTEWNNANAGHLGFKQQFLAHFANNDLKSDALESATHRKQMAGETVEQYQAALEVLWKECDVADMTERMKLKLFLNGLNPIIRQTVRQQAPINLAAAVQTAKAHYRAALVELKPERASVVEVNESMAAEIKELRKKIEQLGRQPERQPERPQFQRPRQMERTRQRVDSIRCFYCKKLGHRKNECRLLAWHIEQGIVTDGQKRDRFRPNQRQGKGQPRQ